MEEAEAAECEFPKHEAARAWPPLSPASLSINSANKTERQELSMISQESRHPLLELNEALSAAFLNLLMPVKIMRLASRK